ncbi:PREDICTED: genetic suppressor element 1-like [Priapulus caudatus]|uniref:Genetic suppressor element 1-like n=1 Tax=Priapulus caudatus TaxID=37621 RepID=A0ABM1F3T3_PRICU|nr:PREDICTED: genetic suppressor element 1-like [Priapulus caudatus]
MSVAVCFVCGGQGAQYLLHASVRERGAYFPFLEQHEPPRGALPPSSDGIVRACSLCYSFLNQQWETYERNRTPHRKRLYWLKRNDSMPFIGAELQQQGEYMSHVLGLHSYETGVPPPPPPPPRPDHSSRLAADLHLKGGAPTRDAMMRHDAGQRRGERSARPEATSARGDAARRPGSAQRPDASSRPPRAGAPPRGDGAQNVRPDNWKLRLAQEEVRTREMTQTMLAGVSNGALDLTMPSRSPSHVVCYVCGAEQARGSAREVHAVARDAALQAPFFPALLEHKRPAKAQPVSDGGGVLTCAPCHDFLGQQWQFYQQHQVPQHQRNGEHTSASTCFLYCRKQSEGHAYFPFLETVAPAKGALPLTPEGLARVCQHCHKVLSKQWKEFEVKGVEQSKRAYSHPTLPVMLPNVPTADAQRPTNPLPNTPRESSGALRSADAAAAARAGVKSALPGGHADAASEVCCYLCAQRCASSSVRFVHTKPGASHRMHFAFVGALPRPPGALEVDADERAATCHDCYKHLRAQWQVYESAMAPHALRTYRLRRPSAQPPAAAAADDKPTAALHIEVPAVSGGGAISSRAPVAGLLMTVDSKQLPLAGATGTSSDAGKAKSNVQQAVWDGEHSSSPAAGGGGGCGPQQKICYVCAEVGELSKCMMMLTRANAAQPSLPFFPILASLEPPEGADAMGADGGVLACRFCCFHLLEQWKLYEMSPTQHAQQRAYNMARFVCYICGMATRRRRLRVLSLRKFTSLVTRPRPPGSVVLDGGDSIVSCLMCYETLCNQWHEYEQMGVPNKLRRYNWLAAPPPPVDEDPLEANRAPARSPGSHSNENTTVDRQTGSKSVVILEDSDTEVDMGGDGTDTTGADDGGPPNNKAASLAMMSAPQRPTRTTATVPPLSQGSPSCVTAVSNNSAINATRTSSFAAALRKLAKQAIDPADLEQGAIAPAAHQGSVSPRRAVPPPLIGSNSQSAMIHTPPVVTIAPTQSHNTESRKSMERLGSTVNMTANPAEHKFDISSRSLAYGDRREDARPPSGEADRLRTSHSRSSMESARGFQPYRPGEEIRPPLPPQMGFDPALYPYHPAYLPPPHSAYGHPAFRLDDPLYMERYANMLRSPFFSLSASPAGMLPHPALHQAMLSGRYPAELISQSLSLTSPGARLPSTSSSERLKLEEEQQQQRMRELEARERELERERQAEVERARDRELERRTEDRGGGGGGSVVIRDQRGDYIRASASRYSPAKHGSGGGGGFTPQDAFYTERNRVQSMGIFIPQDPLAAKSSSSASSGEHGRHRQPPADYRQSLDVKHRSAAHLLHMSKSQDLMAAHRLSQEREPMSLDLSRKRPERDEREPHDRREHHRDSSHHVTSILSRPHHPPSSSSAAAALLHSDRHMVNGGAESERRGDGYAERPRATQDRPSIISELRRAPDHAGTGPRSAKHKHQGPPGVAAAAAAAAAHLLLQRQCERAGYGGAAAAAQYNGVVARKPSPEKLEQPASLQTSGGGRGGARGVIASRPEKSKLDYEIERIKEARMKSMYRSDGEESDEEEAKEERKRMRLLTIAHGPPLQYDGSTRKVSFLSNLGLGTQADKDEMETTKRRKRRRLFREQSTSPDDVQVAPPATSPMLYTRYHPDDLNRERDYTEKTRFLSSLALEIVTLPRRKEMEHVRRTLMENQQQRAAKRLGIKAAAATLSSSMTGGTQRQTGPDSQQVASLKRDAPDEPGTHGHGHLNAKRQHVSSVEVQKSHSLPPQSQPQQYCRPAGTESRQLWTSPGSDLRGQHRLSQDFAHEFHESVLQSTKQALAQKQASSHKSFLAGGGSNGGDTVQTSHRATEEKPALAHKGHHHHHHHHHRHQHLHLLPAKKKPNTEIPVKIPAAQYTSLVSSARPRQTIIPQSDSQATMGREELRGYMPQGKEEQVGDDAAFSWEDGRELAGREISVTPSAGTASFRWPGVESVMEAYRRHMEEQNQERAFLLDHCLKVRGNNAELADTTEKLTLQLSALRHTKQKIDEDRACRQAALDNLKKTMKLLR